jgi:hypothetical protein
MMTVAKITAAKIHGPQRTASTCRTVRVRKKSFDARAQMRFHSRAEQSMLNFLGKLFFRRSPHWKRRRQVRILLWSIGAAILFSLIAIGVMLLTNKTHG